MLNILNVIFGVRWNFCKQHSYVYFYNKDNISSKASWFSRVKDQIEWGLEQAGFEESVPTHGKGVGTRWSTESLPTQIILYICDFPLSP